MTRHVLVTQLITPTIIWTAEHAESFGAVHNNRVPKYLTLYAAKLEEH